MSTHYISGSGWSIPERLVREGRDVKNLVRIQFITQRDLDDGDGWCLVDEGHYWPCAPQVGDCFLMEAVWIEGGAEKPKTRDWKNWKVLRRSVLLSGSAAQEMSGILQLLVCRVPEKSEAGAGYRRRD